MTLPSGWFQFGGGGSYAGEVDHDQAATGLGVAVGRTGRGEFSGSWISGFEQNGVFTSSSGLLRYEGQWLDGGRNGYGIETREEWVYRGEWANGFKGRHGTRQSLLTPAKFEGTWTSGLQDGYGVETYADGGVYQGQWLNGLRHGYGMRQSATYAETVRSRDSFRTRNAGRQSTNSQSTGNFELTSVLGKRNQRIEVGGGFVLTEDVAFGGNRRKFWTPGFSRKFSGGLKQTGRTSSECFAERGHLDTGGHRNTGGHPNTGGQPDTRGHLDTGVNFDTGSRLDTGALAEKRSYPDLAVGSRTNPAHDEDDDTWSICDRVQVLQGELMENYLGEWKQDRRCGYGICQRSDGLKYEGEWLNNKKSGYGRTTLPNGGRLEGKYKNNVLVSSISRSGKGVKFLSMGLAEKVENAVKGAQTAAENAKQKADISSIRAATARDKAEIASAAALGAVKIAEMAHCRAAEMKQQQTSRPGDNLKVHRIDEDVFHLEHGAASVVTATTGTTKKSKLGASSSPSTRFQSPFSRARQTQSVQNFDANHDRKSAPSKWFSFPRRKPKITGNNRTPVERLDFASHGQSPIDTIVEEAGVDGRFQGHPLGQTVPSQWGPGGHGSAADRMRLKMAPRWNASLAQTDGGLLGEKIKRELLEATEPKDAMHPRRNSLPSIIKDRTILPSPPPSVSPPHAAYHKPEIVARPAATPPAPRVSHTETYVVEKGVRKRVKYLYEEVENVQQTPSAKKKPKPPPFGSPGAMGKLILSTMVTGFALSQSTPLRDWTNGDKRNFRRMYALESPTLRRKTKIGSASDVSAIKPSDMLSREQVYVMSQRKREEIIQRRIEEDVTRRRSEGEFGISIRGLRDCRLVPVFVLLAAVASVVFLLHRLGFIDVAPSH